jgi:hypothetical protein
VTIKVPTCPYCGAVAELADSSVIYGESYGKVWICPDYPRCDSFVGCHGGTDKPLGRMANRELRTAKKAAHTAFDALWRAKIKQQGCPKAFARGAGYRWLSKQLGVPVQECHIGMFDVALCQQVVQVCKPYLTPKETP